MPSSMYKATQVLVLEETGSLVCRRIFIVTFILWQSLGRKPSRGHPEETGCDKQTWQLKQKIRAGKCLCIQRRWASQLVPLQIIEEGRGQRVSSVEDHRVLADGVYKKQLLAVVEAGRDSVGCWWSLYCDTHPGLISLWRASIMWGCIVMKDWNTQWPLWCTTDDVSY